MSEDSSFAPLMARLQAGDDEAAAFIFRRFAHRLLALAQARLSAALRQKEDPEDAVQSAFKSFFRRLADRPCEVGGWDNLWSLLALLTVRKCQDRAEAYGAARRDVRREAAPTAGEGACWEAFAREPTPEEAVLLAETVERLLSGLEGYQRQVVELSLQGESVADISARLAVSERSVQRVLAGVRQRLQRWQADAGRA